MSALCSEVDEDGVQCGKPAGHQSVLHSQVVNGQLVVWEDMARIIELREHYCCPRDKTDG